jgi:hypothetical protein
VTMIATASRRTLRLSPAFAGWVVGLVILIFFSIGVNTQSRGWYSWYLLATHSQEIQGIVTRTQPEIHQTCYFSYSLNSRQYEGADQGCTAKVGQLLTIRVLPTEPPFATSSSPIEQLAMLTLGPLALSIFGGLMTAWRVSRVLAKRYGMARNTRG